ncbi:MAG: hypothetical protein EAY75_04065 [Bacteroidetes bacterium]|nr:MAG: hypothetical protein EAY75_04065 [Bacteroidota bacterium]
MASNTHFLMKTGKRTAKKADEIGSTNSNWSTHEMSVTNFARFWQLRVNERFMGQWGGKKVCLVLMNGRQLCLVASGQYGHDGPKIGGSIGGG